MRNRYRQPYNCQCNREVQVIHQPKNSGGCAEHPLAIASVPMQKWRGLYEPCEALSAGTIFTELNLPYRMGGCRK